MFASATIETFRRWQTERKIAALVIQSHGKHTEAAVLRDDSGSAYQVVFHGAGLYFRPSLTVSEYLPDSMRVLHQQKLHPTIFTLRRDLDRALEQICDWMSENKAKRVPQEEEMKLIQEMFKKAKEPNQTVEPTAPSGRGSA